MPRFEVIQPQDISKPLVDSLLEALPNPNPKSSYKIMGRGTPMEIAEFWKTPKAKALRSGSRRVVDALIPERGAVNIPGNHGKTKREKLESFIQGKKWRTPVERLIVSAGSLIFE